MIIGRRPVASAEQVPQKRSKTDGNSYNAFCRHRAPPRGVSWRSSFARLQHQSRRHLPQVCAGTAAFVDGSRAATLARPSVPDFTSEGIATAAGASALTAEAGGSVASEGVAATESGAWTWTGCAGGAEAVAAAGVITGDGVGAVVPATRSDVSAAAPAGAAGSKAVRTTTGALPASASASAERPTSDSTTAAPAVAPIAMATTTIRAVRAKLGAGTMYPHSGCELPAKRITASEAVNQLPAAHYRTSSTRNQFLRTGILPLSDDPYARQAEDGGKPVDRRQTAAFYRQVACELHTKWGKFCCAALIPSNFCRNFAGNFGGNFGGNFRAQFFAG